MNRRYARWTQDELRQAFTLRSEGLSLAEVARRLGRTAHSVRRKLHLTRGAPAKAEVPASRPCVLCGTRFTPSHWNRKKCDECRTTFYNTGYLTPAQERTVRRFAGKIYIHELAAKVGVSKPTLVRWARRTKVSLNALKYTDRVVKEVCEYYVQHGRHKTQKRFPDVNVRSVVERYLAGLTDERRQVRWTPAQLIRLVKMAGLVSFSRQAERFGRPGAHAGSVKSAWTKRFKVGSANINGLSYWTARGYVTKACPFYETDFWEKRVTIDRKRSTTQVRKIALWIDVARHLRDDVPDHLASAIQAMARFQVWLHGEDARGSITSILGGRLP